MFQQLRQELDTLPASISKEDLNISNLLQFPPGIYKLLMWIIRRKSTEPDSMAQYIQQDEATAQEFLDELVKHGLLETIEVQQGTQYRVSIHSSRSYRVPGKIWEALDE